MEIEVDGHKYEVIPIPPGLSPYSTLISTLMQKQSETVEQAEAVSSEINKAMERLLAGTVTPIPKVEHQLQLFNAVITATNEAIKQGENFRKNKRSYSQENGPTCPHTSQETK